MKPRDSSDGEVEALEAACERLAGFDARIGLEWLDGCMAALLDGPRWPAFDEWVERVHGDVWALTFADPADVQQAAATLQRRWAVLASQLDADALYDAPDQPRVAPLLASGDLHDAGDWPLTGEMWAQGVFEAIDVLARSRRSPPTPAG